MRNFLKFLSIIFLLLFLTISKTNADAVQISEKDYKNIVNITPKDNPQKKYYIPKSEDKKIIILKNTENDSQKNIKNINVDSPSGRIISQSTRKINAIYPADNAIVTNNYPGHRGPDQLVIYNTGFASNTQTNEFGKEAVVIDGIVVKLTGANSNIPSNGYVISGHGTAKKWISENLKIGTQVQITGRTIKAFTTIDSYRYYAKSKINAVEDVLLSTKQDYSVRDDKLIYYHLKKAKGQYKRSLKNNSDESLECAKEAIESASLAFRYTLPYLQNELKGTWIRPTSKNINDIQRTLDKIKQTGINNIFLETYFHGRTIFPSSVMESYGFEKQNPEFLGVDVLAIWVKEAHKRGIKIHTWFESFYVGNRSPEINRKSILAIKPNWMNRTRQKADYKGWVMHPQEHNGYFLDPANPEVTAFLLKLIAEMTAKYNIDGVNLDYVRYPNVAKENFNNQWGYTPYAREEFYNLYEIDPAELEPKGAMWENWCEYRRDKISNYIQKVSELLKNRNIILSTVIFPDYKVSLQTKHQDWARWANQKYVNALTPLILTADDDLAKSMLEEIRKKTPLDVNVYPGLFAGFIESDPEDLLKQIHITRKLKLGGVILFDWAHLNDNYLDVLKTSVFKNSY